MQEVNTTKLHHYIRWLHSLIISSLTSSIDGQEVIVAAVENIMWQNQSFPMSLGANVL